jgi:hypothetical protein
MKTYNGHTIIRKQHTTRHYSNHRICLEYKKLAKPSHDYSLWCIEDGKQIGWPVSKKVFDNYDVPVTEMKS